MVAQKTWSHSKYIMKEGPFNQGQQSQGALGHPHWLPSECPMWPLVPRKYSIQNYRILELKTYVVNHGGAWKLKGKKTVPGHMAAQGLSRWDPQDHVMHLMGGWSWGQHEPTTALHATHVGCNYFVTIAFGKCVNHVYHNLTADTAPKTTQEETPSQTYVAVSKPRVGWWE